MKKVFSLSFAVLLFLSIFFINSESVHADESFIEVSGFKPYGTLVHSGDYLFTSGDYDCYLSSGSAYVFLMRGIYTSPVNGVVYDHYRFFLYGFDGMNFLPDYSFHNDDGSVETVDVGSSYSSLTYNMVSTGYEYACSFGVSDFSKCASLPVLNVGFDFADVTYTDAYLNDIFLDLVNGNSGGFTWENVDPDFDSAEFSADLGSLQDITYKQLYEKTATGHDVYYKFDWNTRTSSGVDLTQGNYDVIYYWECSADAVSLFGNKSTINPIYSDKFLCKSKQDGKVYSIIENSAEGDFAIIFNEVIDQQPLVCRSFDVKSTLHIAPIFYDGEAYQIGYWSHLTFDNLANSEPIQDLIQDEVDGNGIEVNYDVTSDDPSISSSTGSSTIGVGSTIDEAEHNSNAGTSSSVNLDETSTNVTEAIGMFVGAIKSFVNLVSVTFSFLPDWVLAFVSLSVIIFCIMIVKRAIL